MTTLGHIDLNASETINELVARAPQVLPVLQQYGIDTCCGGSLSLEVVAERHQLDLVQLLSELQASIEKQP